MEIATILAGSLVLATLCTLLQLVRDTATPEEAIQVGVLLAVLPAAVLAGVAMRDGSIRSALPRIVLFLSGLALSSVVIVLVRQ